MSHEIFGERFLGRSVPAWHSLGFTFEEERDITFRDGVIECGAGYEIHKLPVPSIEAFGTKVTPPQFALVRGPSGTDTAEFLNFVDKDYEVVTNLDIADTLEPLAKEWKLETVGALGRGERFFATLKIGQTALNGSDYVDRYFLVNGNHGNGHGITIAVTTVRVVCANTLKLALNSAETVSLSHRIGAQGDLAVASSIIAQLHNADSVAVSNLQRLAAAKVSDAQVDAIIKAAFPDATEPKKARFAREAREAGLVAEADHFKYATDNYRRYQEEADENRKLAHACYDKINAEFDDIASTAWAALNACTEVSNHREGRGNIDESIVFGSRGNECSKALAQALEIANSVLV